MNFSKSPSFSDLPGAKYPSFMGMVGQSPAIKKIFTRIVIAAEDESANVVIGGEAGTGKNLAALAIHAHSPRRKRRCLLFRCAGEPEEVLLRKLLGSPRQSFYGRHRDIDGALVCTEGGFLVFDEMGEMPDQLQLHLLRILQDRAFTPLGGRSSVPLNTRFVFTTRCEPEVLMAEGRLRPELYYRLNAVNLSLPALRERKEDIPLLVRFFSEKYARNRGLEPPTFSRRACELFEEYPWRGNIRELSNIVYNLSLFHCGERIDVESLPRKFSASLGQNAQKQEEVKSQESPSAPLHSAILSSSLETLWQEGRVDFRALVNSFETELIVYALQQTEGNKKEAARLLNLKRTTLVEKIKKKAIGDLL
ncbi:MAG: sigma-54-dependent Fis family transcriptional regulator [Deltaproteobacteria bacterium]|nr:MAG: sigma-54-dependent Fis family transcriptional regulator [Deltaproteobacteria bacterium]PIE73116.1 MAG: sigma-54-dependent Fis family transcriptional regulator [Deltaproteobacteria bacterium]